MEFFFIISDNESLSEGIRNPPPLKEDAEEDYYISMGPKSEEGTSQSSGDEGPRAPLPPRGFSRGRQAVSRKRVLDDLVPPPTTQAPPPPCASGAHSYVNTPSTTAMDTVVNSATKTSNSSTGSCPYDNAFSTAAPDTQGSSDDDFDAWDEPVPVVKKPLGKTASIDSYLEPVDAPNYERLLSEEMSHTEQERASQAMEQHIYGNLVHPEPQDEDDDLYESMREAERLHLGAAVGGNRDSENYVIMGGEEERDSGHYMRMDGRDNADYMVVPEEDPTPPTSPTEPEPVS